MSHKYIYQSKLKAKVLLLRTKHGFAKVNDNYKRVSEFYNKTKFEVYIQMARKYVHSVKTGFLQWPLQVIYILDLAHGYYTKNTPIQKLPSRHKQKKINQRFIFHQQIHTYRHYCQHSTASKSTST